MTTGQRHEAGTRLSPAREASPGPPGAAWPGLTARGAPGGDAEDDATVIRRSRDEPAHFAELFRRHAPEIQRYVRRRLGTDAADDVVAETFLAAFCQRQGYDLARESARPWLYGIATNLIGRHRRTEVRQYRVLARTGHDPVTEPFTDRVDAAVSAAGMRRQLADGLARLPAAYRDTLLLVAWGDLSYAEAAAALGVPVGTIRSRLNRARGSLRRSLGVASPETEHDHERGESS
jgi:RNA polymerase sigma-70 factor (ECF subfamily)